MDPALREHYLQMARDNPNMLCSQVPVEILADLLRDFLEAGFNQ